MSSTFQVNDMTCRHCASTITRALGLLDPKAKVNVDLATRRVEVSSADADGAQLQDAIKEAGYTPVLVQPGAAATSQSKRSGCGCGCG